MRSRVQDTKKKFRPIDDEPNSAGYPYGTFANGYFLQLKTTFVSSNHRQRPLNSDNPMPSRCSFCTKYRIIARLVSALFRPLKTTSVAGPFAANKNPNERFTRSITPWYYSLVSYYCFQRRREKSPFWPRFYMIRRSSSNLWVVLTAFFAVHCAHYSIGDEPVPKPVRVETVAVPADVDLDGGELANLLVSELNERGFSASWGPRGDVVCAVSVEHAVGFGVSASPVATMSCQVGEESFETTGDSQGNVGQEYRISTRNVVLSNAAQNAAGRMVPKIDRALRGN